MVPHTMKRRKLAHDTNSAHESGHSSIHNQTTDDDERNNSSDDYNVISSAPGDSRILQNVPSHTARIGSRNGPLLAREVYRSNIINLQIDELLEEVRPDYRTLLTGTERVLRKLKATIESLPKREPLTVLEAEKDLRKNYNTTIPFPEPKPTGDLRYSLEYTRPASIHVVGSYALKTLITTGEDFAIDLAVTIPPVLIRDKDFKDYRYLHKRAYYIACLAAGLETVGFNINYVYQHGNPLLPILAVMPSQGDGEGNDQHSKCIIHIITMIPETSFPISKTWPDKINVQIDKPEYSSAVLSPAMSIYNATVRSESSVTAYLKLLFQASRSCRSFTDCCVLGRIWLRQRGFGKSFAKGGFGPFEWAAICAILLETGGSRGKSLLSAGHDSYQLFKTILQLLATRDLTAVPFLFHADGLKPHISESPMFFDGPRGMNILFKMTPWSYTLLRHEAQMTLSMINDSMSNYFESIFITRLDEPLQRFDELICIPWSAARTNTKEHLNIVSLVNDFGHKLYKVLREALSDRVYLIHLASPEAGGWPTKIRAPTILNQGYIVVGFLLNADNAARLVDHGPSAEDKEAASAFRKFWGEKAELRRFKDGSILESLVWSDEEPSTPVLLRILLYVLQRHFGHDVIKTLNLVGPSFSQLLPNNKSKDSTQPLAPFRAVMTAFETLQRDLRALDGLPLHLRHVSATSPELRYASYGLPSNSVETDHQRPLDVVAEFESSARWPESFVAIQRTKIAFLLRIGELLGEAVNGIVTRLGLENGTHTILNASFLDVIYPTGPAFRVRIYHEREYVLLERKLVHDSLDLRTKEETSMALSAYSRDFVQLSLHTESIKTLCTRFSLLSPTIRLLKRWCNSHLLSPHISEELIELLVVRTFVRPYPWRAPSSVMTGFLRTLAFISKWDWRTEPLIVPLNDRLDPKDIETLKVRFEAWRKIDPGMNRVVVFAASNLDLTGATWTESGPSKVVAARFTSLAKAASNVVKESGSAIDPTKLFTSSTADYDFVIHLRSISSSNSGRTVAKQAHFKNLQVHFSRNSDLIGHDPMELFLTELKTQYRNTIVLFYDTEAKHVIAGLWNPQVGPRQWKVNLTYSTSPLLNEEGENEPQVGINKLATLNDIARLGRDLIELIEINR